MKTLQKQISPNGEDALNIVFQNRKYYDLVKMILAELKEKGIKHIKLE